MSDCPLGFVLPPRSQRDLYAGRVRSLPKHCRTRALVLKPLELFGGIAARPGDAIAVSEFDARCLEAMGYLIPIRDLTVNSRMSARKKSPDTLLTTEV